MRSFAYSAIRAGSSSSSGGARMQRVAMSAGCGRSQLAGGSDPTGAEPTRPVRPPRGYSQGAKMTLRGQEDPSLDCRARSWHHAPQRVKAPGWLRAPSARAVARRQETGAERTRYTAGM